MARITASLDRGVIELEPVPGECVVENGQLIDVKSYYTAHTNIQTLTLLDEKTHGSNWVKWRTQSQPIRTALNIAVRVKISLNQTVPVYQKLSPKIKELKALGMTYEAISKRLNINKKTVAKALH